MWYCLRCNQLSRNKYQLNRRYVLMKNGKYLARHRDYLDFRVAIKREEYKDYKLDCNCPACDSYGYIRVRYRDFIKPYDKVCGDIDIYGYSFASFHNLIKEEDRERIYNDIRTQMLNLRKSMKTERILYEMEGV